MRELCHNLVYDITNDIGPNNCFGILSPCKFVVLVSLPNCFSVQEKFQSFHGIVANFSPTLGEQSVAKKSAFLFSHFQLNSLNINYDSDLIMMTDAALNAEIEETSDEALTTTCMDLQVGLES